MKRITTALTRVIATAALRHAWAIMEAAERHRDRGARMEAWVEGMAVRWGCAEEVLHTITTETLSS
jgi:hypothetical protein